MKTKKVSMLSLFLLLSFSYSNGYEAVSRKKTCINTGWQFYLGNPDADFYKSDTDDTAWETISVPHTLELASLTLNMCDDDKTQPTFQRDAGWYRKNLKVTADKSRKIFLEFEGAHQATTCWINGQKAGHFAISGYTPFHFDISNYVNYGSENQITLLVDNRRSDVLPPDPGPFDYVKFSGLYRDVYLVEKSPVHITFNWEKRKAGINITTPVVDPICKNAVIDVKTVVRNTTSAEQECCVVNRVIDHRGVTVLKMKDEAIITPGTDYEFAQIGAMEDDVRFWDINNPYLYRVNTQVLHNEKVIDEVENNLGLRKFRLDNELGFMLNDKPIEIIGFNRHQHHAYIGDALPNSLHYKDMLQFKEMGLNMVRTAHYPQDDALIEACDKLGILVYEEAPTWIDMPKNNLWWENLKESTRRMVRNHRNHPSIVIWGGGLNHRGYIPEVITAVKQEDPTRLTASQGSRWTGWQASGLSDINANMLYGPFHWDRSEVMFAMEGHAGPATVAEHKRDPKMGGILSWTAHAYHTFHPTHDKYQNPIDRTRGGAMTIFRQPKSNEKEILWYPSEMKDEPYLHIDNDWKPETKKLTIYSNADEIKLYINGTFYQTIKPSTDQQFEGLNHPPFYVNVSNFKAGELRAVAYKDGKTFAEKTIKTPQEAVALQWRVDDAGRCFKADGADIMVAYAQIVDENSTIIKDYEGNVKFTINGEGSIIGEGIDIGANPKYVEMGEAAVLIRASTNAGEIKITAECEGLEPATTTLKTKTANYNLSEHKPFYDFESLRVDLGAPDQLVQFGWYEWSNPDNENANTTLPVLGGIDAVIKTNSSEGVLRWLGEMNVMGKYGFAYGEGVIGIDKEGFTLKFANLPKGTYRLRSWHHAPSTNTDHMDTNVNKLKSLKIPSLPYAEEIEISVGSEKVTLATTNGKSMHEKNPAVSEIIFEANGTSIDIIYKDVKGEKGVWLNAFELSEWSPDL